MLSATLSTVCPCSTLCGLRFLEHISDGLSAEEATCSRVIHARRANPHLRRWLRSPREAWTLRRRLKDSKYDIAIDLQGLTKSAMVSRLSGARRRIGFGGADGRELSGWLNNEGACRRLPRT